MDIEAKWALLIVCYIVVQSVVAAGLSALFQSAKSTKGDSDGA